MAWGASLSSRGLGSSRSTPQPQRRSMGDALPKTDMATERASLAPVFENHSLLATTAPLTVHVEVQFTDPAIKSRYCRSYGSSPSFEPTPRICRGLMRRIERCSEELITRQDPGALDVFKDESAERKSLRYEMTFRIIRRGKGEWAEMTFRSYQKQPLTVELTKDIMLATHRIVGLFLRRHDQNFLWLDFPASDMDHEEPQTTKPDDPLSLFCVPNSRFNEAMQAFDFVSGYKIEVSFCSRNPQRKAPLIRKALRVNSTQAAPLTLFMSEDLLWKGLQAINYELDTRKKEFDDHFSRRVDTHHSSDGAVEIDLTISNNLGPAYTHVHRTVQSRFNLFRHPDGRDCDEFLKRVEISLAGFRDHTDAKVNSLDDLELNICEVKGAGWKLKQPLRFSIGSSSSYGRRTIQAALDRIQTGIADVIRGRELAVHLIAHKRGHLVLDKTIVAHEKRGQPKEWFHSPAEEQQALVSRLHSRIQTDIDMVFEDSCSIDDLPDEEEHVRPPTPGLSQRALSSRAPSEPSEGSSASSFKTPSKLSRSLSSRLTASPKKFVQRVFSLGRKSSESSKSKKAGDTLKTAKSVESIGSVDSKKSGKFSFFGKREDRPPSGVVDEPKPSRRSFSLMSRRSAKNRVSNASTLVEEEDEDAHARQDIHVGEFKSGESHESRAQTVGSNMTSMSTEKTVRRLLPNPAKNDDRTSFSVHESRRSKMDTPGAYEDAREYILSPVDPTRGSSPSRFDEYSTAPSTPGLSAGSLDSSPRNSIMITPAYYETSSVTRDPVLRNCDVVGCECEQPRMDDAAEIVVEEPEPKTSFATEQPSVAQPNLNLPRTQLKEPSLKLHDEPNEPIDAAGEPAAQRYGSGPEADLVEPTPTPENSNTDQSLNPDTTCETSPVDQGQKEEFGAETSPETNHPSAVPEHPDFPTHEVRNAKPSQEPNSDSDLYASDSEIKAEGPRDRDMSESTGQEVGTATGAEVEPEEDNVKQGPSMSVTGPSIDVTEEITEQKSGEETGTDENLDLVEHGPELVNGASERSDAVDVGSAKKTNGASGEPNIVDEVTEKQAEDSQNPISETELKGEPEPVIERHPIKFDEVAALSASEPESLPVSGPVEVTETVDGPEVETEDVRVEVAANEQLVTEEQTPAPVEKPAVDEDVATVTQEATMAREVDLAEADGAEAAAEEHLVTEEQAIAPIDQGTAPEEKPTVAEDEPKITGENPIVVADGSMATEEFATTPEVAATATEEPAPAAEQEAPAPTDQSTYFEEQLAVAQEEPTVAEEVVTAPEVGAVAPEDQATASDKNVAVAEDEAPAFVGQCPFPEEQPAVAEDEPAVTEEESVVAEKELMVIKELATAPVEEAVTAEEQATSLAQNFAAAEEEVPDPEVVSNSYTRTELVGDDTVAGDGLASEEASTEQATAPAEETTIFENVTVVLEEQFPDAKEGVAVPEEQTTAPESDIKVIERDATEPDGQGEQPVAAAPEEPAVPEKAAVTEEQAIAPQADATEAEQNLTVREEDATTTVEETTAPEVVADSVIAAEDLASEKQLAAADQEAATPEVQLAAVEGEIAVPEEAVGTERQDTSPAISFTLTEKEANVEEAAAPAAVADSVAVKEEQLVDLKEDAVPKENVATEKQATSVDMDANANEEETEVPEVIVEEAMTPVVIADFVTINEDFASEEQPAAPEEKEAAVSERTPGTDVTSVEEKANATTEQATALEAAEEQPVGEAIVENQVEPKEKVLTLSEDKIMDSGDVVAPEAVVEHCNASEEPAAASEAVDQQLPKGLSQDKSTALQIAVPEAAEDHPVEKASRDESVATSAEPEGQAKAPLPTELETVNYRQPIFPVSIIENQFETEEKVPIPTEARVIENGEVIVPGAVREHRLVSDEPAAVPDAVFQEQTEETPGNEAMQLEAEIVDSLQIVVSDAVVENQLASELEAQAEDDVQVVSLPVLPLNGTLHPQKETAMTDAEEELAKELEVQASSSSEEEMMEERQEETESPTHDWSKQLAPEVIISQIVGAAISEDGIPTIMKDEPKALIRSKEDDFKQQAPEALISQILGGAISEEVPITEDDGRKPEMPEQQPVIEQHVVAPTISVKDFTHQLPEDSLTGEVTAVSKEAQTTTENTQEEAHKPEHPYTRSVPVPDEAFLHPNRASASTLSSTWSYSDTASLLSRGSVDTYRPSIDERRDGEEEEDPEEYHYHFRSCPQTAGLLGLQRDSPRFVCEVGLRGALGDLSHRRRRKSLPTNSIPASEFVKRRRAKSTAVKNEPAAAPPHDKAGEGEGETVIPKIMWLFSGAMALGKMMRGS